MTFPGELSLWRLLIQNGINMHCQYEGERVFNLLIKRPAFIESEKFKIYRNALIKELSSTFSYSNYDEFRQRVIESIDNEDIVLVDSDHLKALSFLRNDQQDLEDVIRHLKSLEFKERLIVDYLNVLEDQKKLLENRKTKLSAHFPELSQSHVTKEKCQLDRIKLNKIASDEALENLFKLEDTQENRIKKTKKSN
jgi:hypothetical protein